VQPLPQCGGVCGSACGGGGRQQRQQRHGGAAVAGAGRGVSAAAAAWGARWLQLIDWRGGSRQGEARGVWALTGEPQGTASCVIMLLLGRDPCLDFAGAAVCCWGRTGTGGFSGTGAMPSSGRCLTGCVGLSVVMFCAGAQRQAKGGCIAGLVLIATSSPQQQLQQQDCMSPEADPGTGRA